MTRSIDRRIFLMTVATSGATLGVLAHAQTLVDEKDGQALALAYVVDAKRVDSKKHGKFAPGQNCSNCALYQGKASDKAAACPLFAGKLVAGPGWCTAWARKA